MNVLSTCPDDTCRIESILNVGSADRPETGSSRVYGPPGGPSFLGAPAYTSIPTKLNASPALPPVSSLLDMTSGADPFHTRGKRVMAPSLQSLSDTSGTEYSNPSQFGWTFQAISSASPRPCGQNLPGPQTMKSSKRFNTQEELCNHQRKRPFPCAETGCPKRFKKNGDAVRH
ncbi:hypothetical protein K469DRAFT_708961 [Zopfia rhizophila CBS 207.26]|uniref:Uncharacterized protein n=1 Tax=Zopfia rhizophila CBS 207.26 TaxID=1314779 RepID=A0A6A6E171_9PEZI|nr:hypothetical protein K469DRAFT_708961 [Zopfia rhizophila CBS 207.26]